jgi:recombinational DNA repair protein (RecF pathway)
MYSFTRPRKVASVSKPCANCGAPLPVPAGSAREAESLCSNCARPVRLGAVRSVGHLNGEARPRGAVG